MDVHLDKFLTKKRIVFILREIRESVQRDISPVLSAYKDTNNWLDHHVPGFWTIPRLLFPEIDGFARFRYGTPTRSGRDIARDAIKFMQNYFRLNKQSQNASLMYVIYRHGLLHSHYPKTVVINNKEIKWIIGYNIDKGVYGETTKFNLGGEQKDALILQVEDFYKDFMDATEIYIKEFDNSSREMELVANFKKAYVKIHEPIKENDI